MDPYLNDPKIKILIVCTDGEYTAFENNKGAEAVMINTIKILRHFFPSAIFTTTIQLSENLRQLLDCHVLKRKIFSIKQYSPLTSFKSSFDLFRALLRKLLLKYFKINLKILLNNDKLRAYSAADVVIHLGMDLYSEDFGIREIIEQSKDILLAVSLDKPIVMWAESPGPFRSYLVRKIAGFTMKKVSLISVREKVSTEHIRQLGIVNSKIYQTADPAFLLEPAEETIIKSILKNENIPDDKTSLIGICLSPAYLAGSVDKPRSISIMKSSYQLLQYLLPEKVFQALVRIAKRSSLYSAPLSQQTGYTTVIAQVVDYLTKCFNANIILIPHLSGGGPLMEDRVFHNEVRKLAVEKDRIWLLSGQYTAAEIKGIIGKCNLFIGGKMHSNIAALSQYIPTVGLSYSHKFEGIMCMLEQQDFVCRCVSYAEITAKAEIAWQQRETIRAKLEALMPQVKDQAFHNGELVKDLLESKKLSK